MSVKVYTEELVYTTTEDGLMLEGAVIRPATGPAHPVAMIWLHGLAGRFYAPLMVRVGRELAGAGYTFVTGNNRGHDFGSVLWTTNGKMKLVGSAWERFGESPYDVAAWVDLAAKIGFESVVLIGHSLGALKAVYYQAERQDPHVIGLVAASPPLRAGRVKPELMAQAERMVAEGRGQDLLPWGIIPVGGGTFSAQTYLHRTQVNLDVFGAQTPNPAVERIRCPLFAFFGTNEAWVGTAADLETIRRNATAAVRVDTRMFAGADHRYAGREIEVAEAIVEWADTLLPG